MSGVDGQRARLINLSKYCAQMPQKHNLSQSQVLKSPRTTWTQGDSTQGAFGSEYNGRGACLFFSYPLLQNACLKQQGPTVVALYFGTEY